MAGLESPTYQAARYLNTAVYFSGNAPGLPANYYRVARGLFCFALCGLSLAELPVRALTAVRYFVYNLLHHCNPFDKY